MRSQRLASGAPLGGIGCGSFQLMTDGTVSRVAINNNWDRPIDDPKGCFAAVWTRAGGRTEARVLALRSGYGLPVVSAVDYQGLFPQALVDYPDARLPVSIRLRAFSPLIPQDRRNSAVPATLFVFTLKNLARAPVEASVAVSWECLLGVGGTTTTGPFADRTGDTVGKIGALAPPAPGMFGMEMRSPVRQIKDPPDRLRYNASGTYALLTRPELPAAIVTTAGWNALDRAPGWWAGFAREGEVAGSVGAGAEGHVHPAGAVAVKVALKANEMVEVPFVVAWYTPRLFTLDGLEYGHLYQLSWDDAVEVGRYALENRLSLAALMAEWQDRLLRSSLPPWLTARLINDAAPLFTNTIATRDSALAGKSPGPSLFTALRRPTDSSSAGALGAMDERLFIASLYACWLPALDVREMGQFAELQAPSGAIPRFDGNIDREIDGPRTADREEPAATDFLSSCAFAYQVYRYFLWTGDQTYLDRFYPVAKHALQFAATQADRETGRQGDSAAENRKSKIENRKSYGLWPGVVLVGRAMAARMDDRRFVVECDGWLAKARAKPVDDPAGAALGAWMAASVEADGDAEGMPAGFTGAPLDAAAAVDAPLACVTAALEALRGSPDAGLALMRALDLRIVEGLRSPWQYADTLPAATSAPDGGPPPTASLGMAASWAYLQALEGFTVDVAAGRLTIAPRLPEGWKELSAPVFSPTFWGTLDYRPSPQRTYVSFRLDRYLPVAVSSSEEPRKLTGMLGHTAALVLKQVALPALPETLSRGPQVTASVGRAPTPGKLTRDARGRTVFTFDTPLTLSVGDRLEFIFRPQTGAR